MGRRRRCEVEEGEKEGRERGRKFIGVWSVTIPMPSGFGGRVPCVCVFSCVFSVSH